VSAPTSVPPSITFSTRPLSEVEADALVIGVATQGEEITPAFGASSVESALEGRLSVTLRQLGATGKAGEVTTFATWGAIATPVIAAVGLGTPEADGSLHQAAETLRRAIGSAIRALAGYQRVALALPAPTAETAPLLRAALEGSLLSAYDFIAYKSSLPPEYKAPVREIILALEGEVDLTTEVTRAQAIAAAVHRARDWINTPPNHLRPPSFALAAEELARATGLEVEVLGVQELDAGGYGGILAVGSGSSADPRLVRLHYTPRAGSPRARVALVGKGITFDSGGISIKPSAGMHEMKGDMSGAAAVISTMGALAALQPHVEVTAYVPMAENLPSGTAYRPGDVVTMYGGKKVEVLNTDAEGRMILGDAIARACEDNPDYLIETSTLTGGQMIALGRRISGVMGTPEFCDRVKQAGELAGETMWPMPLPDDVREGMDSAIADISQVNASMDRAGHMLQGGVFLSEFVAEGVVWAHLDIATPAYNSGSPYGYTPKGGTGTPVRTLVTLLEEIAANG
jgi:leucyl aminopeptidase